MGVRDLFPTLRKLVPDSITPVESLAQLGQARSKFAIDGNLLTTKFHFSPSTTTTTTSDHHHAARHRHVKGWYAFLRELERRGIEAVVVFDGPGRILEKERERERRRVARELQKSRGEAETVRKRRLENLRHLWRRESESRVESSAFDPAASDVVKDFIELYDEYERDRANPIYSRYQDLITKGEGQVFRTILERAPSLAPVRDRVDRSRREEPRIDQLARGLETILAGTTSSSREETNATPPSVELEVDGKIGSSSSGASSVRPLAADDRARASLRSEPKSNIDRRSSRFEMTTRSISNRDFEERDVESFALGREPTGQQPLANDDETYTPSTTTTTTTTGRRLNVVVEASTSVLTTAPDGSDDSLSIRESPTDEEGSSQNDSNVGPSLSSSLEENPRIGSSHDHSEEVGPGLSVAGSNPAETVSQIVVVGTHSRSLEESPTLPFGSDVDPGSVPATTTTTNTDSVRPLVVNPAAAAAVAGATTKEPLSSLAPPPPPVSSSRSRRPPEHEVERDLDELITESSRLSKSHLSRSVSVPLHVFSDCKALISSMGYPVLTPSEANPYEAESICSVLYHRRAETGVTHVVSEDTDVVVYSAPLLRRVSTTTTTTTTTKTMMTVTDPVKVRTGLGLNDREFLDFCLLCGTDFTDRLPLLGPTKALGLIRKYGSIESIFERDENVRSRYFGGGDDQGGYERWLETVESARRIFLELPRLDEVVRQGEVVNFFPSEDKDEAEAVLLLSSRWFDKKRERKKELVELKRRFGITVDEDEEDVDDDDELVLASMRRQDDFLASIWLSEQGEEEEDDEEES